MRPVGKAFLLFALSLPVRTVQAQTVPPAPAAAPVAPAVMPAPIPAPAADRGWLGTYFDNYFAMVDAARHGQPEWSSPLVTTTAELEERYRFDTSFQHAGNGNNTVNLDGGKGLDLIVSPTQEVQFGSAPYVFRNNLNGKAGVEGYNDWAFFRFKQRLASSPEDQGNYVVSAWLQIQEPAGVHQLSNNSWTLLPTLGFGKGWGDFDLQGSVGATIPVAYEDRIGSQVNGNIALQYHLAGLFWPQLEANYTYFPDGQRGGKNQLFLTPGFVIGRIPVLDRLKATIGFGYQSAVTPNYHASPLTPSYNHAWITTTRLSF